MAAPPTALSREELPATHPINMVGHRALGAQQSCPLSLPSLHGGEGFLFQVEFHPVTQWTLDLWWALNLVILVW